MNNTAKIAALQSLYDSLPKIECKGLCYGACGPVPMTRLEAKVFGKELTMPVQGLGHVTLTDTKNACCALVAGRCTRYAIRPAMCRLYCLNEKLKCPHGCLPERFLTEAESHAFLDAVHKLGV